MWRRRRIWRLIHCSTVMAGRVPAIYPHHRSADGRNTPGHDVRKRPRPPVLSPDLAYPDTPGHDGEVMDQAAKTFSIQSSSPTLSLLPHTNSQEAINHRIDLVGYLDRAEMAGQQCLRD